MAPGCAGPGPPVVGAVESVAVVEAGLRFRARIDTGAAASSIHARDVRVERGWVHFVLENERGERRALSAPLVDLAHVRGAAGVDVRPRVRLRLSLRGVEKSLPVSLRDRSGMQHPLLVGRDFLAGDFLVDVARTRGEGEVDP
jgi:hypothetical protein